MCWMGGEDAEGAYAGVQSELDALQQRRLVPSEVLETEMMDRHCKSLSFNRRCRLGLQTRCKRQRNPMQQRASHAKRKPKQQ